MNEENCMNLTKSASDTFFQYLEDAMNCKIQPEIKCILKFNYYDNSIAMGKVDESALQEMEDVMRNDFHVNIVPEDDASLYLCRYKNNQKDFKLIGGQKRIILEMAEFCSQLNKSSATSTDHEESFDIARKGKSCIKYKCTKLEALIIIYCHSRTSTQ